MTTASKITLVRVVLIPVYMVLMLLSAGGAEWLRWAAVAVFIIASVSDFLDGYIARHYNQVSDFGKFLDPLADKLLVTACMMIFVGWGRMPSWLVFIVIAREFAISGLRMVAANNGTVIAARQVSCQHSAGNQVHPLNSSLVFSYPTTRAAKSSPVLSPRPNQLSGGQRRRTAQLPKCGRRCNYLLPQCLRFKKNPIQGFP